MNCKSSVAENLKNCRFLDLALSVLFCFLLGEVCGPSAVLAESTDASNTKLAQDDQFVEQQLKDLVTFQRTRSGWLGDGSVPDNVRVLKDLSYSKMSDGGCGSPSPSQKLDLYLPKSDKPLPVVLWIHGGGWRSGDKKGGPFRPLLEAGLAVASINYRLSGEAKWPAQLDDCIAATKYLAAHSKEYNLDSSSMGIWGASAGGHLALMEALQSDTYPELTGIRAVCDWFGPCDLAAYLKNKDSLPMGVSMVRELLGLRSDSGDGFCQEAASSASPFYLLRAGKTRLPTILILHGRSDRLVPLSQSIQFSRKLKKLNRETKVLLKAVPGAHGYPGFGPDAISASVKFLKANLRN